MNNIRISEMRRIARGVALLDSVDPKWYRKIKPSTFGLDDPTQCVLGHIYGQYFTGLRELASQAINRPLETLKFSQQPEVTTQVAGRLNGPYYGFETVSNASYERMGQMWLAIVRRREQAAKRARLLRRGVQR